MKKLKLILLIILASFSIFVLSSCKQDNAPEETDTTFVVGSVMNMTGSFLTYGMFSGGDNVSTIKKLINDYEPVAFTKNEKYEINTTVVEDIKIVEDVIGTTYTLKIKNNLKWSSGEKITAKDYVGSIMLFNNNLLFDVMGQKILPNIDVIGSAEYYNDESGLGELVGVNLISDYEFSFTTEQKVNIVDLSILKITPYPMNVLLPGVSIVQGNNGVKFEGKTTDELKDILYKTIENDFQGYRYYPSVTCGPYKLESLKNEECILVKNDEYVGNYEGQKPEIDKIIIKTVSGTKEQIISSIQSGVIDYYDFGSSITESDLNKLDVNVVNSTMFGSNTVMNIAFHSDKGPVRFKEVRQAVAYLMDNKTIYGDYSLNQWMAKESMNEDGNVLGIDLSGKKVVLNKYEYDVDKAVELIEKAGYIYGDVECSKLYSSGDELRYRKNEKGVGEALILDVLSIDYYSYMFNQLVNSAKGIGFKINVIAGNASSIQNNYLAYNGDGYDNIPENATYEEILNLYNPETDKREGNAYQCNFRCDLMLENRSFTTGLENWGDEGNCYFLYNELLDAAAKELDSIRDSEEKYLEAWQKYQYIYNDELPMLPFNTIEKVILFNSKLKGFEGEVSENWDWAYQIIYCEMTE